MNFMVIVDYMVNFKYNKYLRDAAASDVSTYLYLQSKIGVIVMVAITYKFSRIFKVEENAIAISRKMVECVTAGNFTVE